MNGRYPRQERGSIPPSPGAVVDPTRHPLGGPEILGALWPSLWHLPGARQQRRGPGGQSSWMRKQVPREGEGWAWTTQQGGHRAGAEKAASGARLSGEVEVRGGVVRTWVPDSGAWPHSGQSAVLGRTAATGALSYGHLLCARIRSPGQWPWAVASPLCTGSRVADALRGPRLHWLVSRRDHCSPGTQRLLVWSSARGW